jgi:hypothetical protein
MTLSHRASELDFLYSLTNTNSLSMWIVYPNKKFYFFLFANDWLVLAKGGQDVEHMAKGNTVCPETLHILSHTWWTRLRNHEKKLLFRTLLLVSVEARTPIAPTGTSILFIYRL